MYRKNCIYTLLLLCISALAGAKAEVRVCVTDGYGLSLPKAELLIRAPQNSSVPLVRSQTGADGCAVLSLQTGRAYALSARLSGFAEVTQELGRGDTDVKIMLRPSAAFAVEVTAARIALPLDASASSVRILSAQQLAEAPGLTLDDRLRGVPGFQLFRRTGSYVANPTTQGTSLRGLGSTAASRTLVLSDQVPLNDAFGGWIHWNEIPELAIAGVEVVRGGASDLYGSSAIGGVIDVNPVLPGPRALGLDLAGASEATSSVNGLLRAEHQGWGALGATTLFRTEGYTLTAPEFRGLVDVPSDVHFQAARVELARRFGSEDRVFVRGNLLNEARGNGTPLQTNGTRLWRYAAGVDWARPELGRVLVRGYGDTQSYRQSFSAIAPGRATEQITRLQRVPSEQVGGSAQWARSIRTWTLVAGADLLDTRGTDNETPFNKIAGATITTRARQRDTGGYGEVLWSPAGGWSAALSGRVDRFRSFDARQGVGGVVQSLPETEETVFDPRLGLVRQLGHGMSVSGSAFRAFRGPTLNELYRTGQVGQQITLANPSLVSERATGFEGGGLWERPRLGSVRASYFWTEVNRPVAAVTIASTATTLTQRRENLGQLRSRGVSVEGEMRAVRRIVLTAGYQLAVSTVTRFGANPALVGKWTAEVPRNSFTAQGRWDGGRRWGTLALDLRTSGRQYDDSANVYELHGYTEVGGYYERTVWERVSGYASVQNLLDRRIEAGRTPVLTLGTPRVVEIGVRLR